MDLLDALNDATVSASARKESVWIESTSVESKKAYYYNAASSDVLWSEPPNMWHKARD